MIQNRISVEAFERNAFGAALAAASRPPGSRGEPILEGQIAYLARYGERLGAKTVVREDHYVDRHFLDEYALYYCLSLEPPPNSVRRFHLFSSTFDDAGLSTSLEKAASGHGAAKAVATEMTGNYLGFISIRPLPSVPIGRTVLRRLDDGASREIWATGRHPVHLANVELSVEGLAFLQQDVAVGACATAALWSALSRVMRNEGIRAPTPAEVSQAATRSQMAGGRAFPPVTGLTVQHLGEAIRSLGFAAETFRADEMPEIFAIALHTYLLSGIPVVLALRKDDGAGHAVTAVGFQVGESATRLLESSIPVRSSRLKKLYIHDDRLGPYARAILRPIDLTEEFGESIWLEISRDRDDGARTSEPEAKEVWLIDSGVVPIYPKIRLSVRSLIVLAHNLTELIEEAVGPAKAPRIAVEFMYQRSGAYLASLTGRVGSSSAGFLRSVALPRWCALVRFWCGDTQLAEFVYDTTEIQRDGRQSANELLRAVVCLDQAYRKDIEVIAGVFGVPWV